jgi:hypothetical protein
MPVMVLYFFRLFSVASVAKKPVVRGDLASNLYLTSLWLLCGCRGTRLNKGVRQINMSKKTQK